jgi:hypothetical protein
MQGQYNKSIGRQLITEEDTCPRVSRGDLKAETGSEIITKHDEALQTKYHAKTNITEIESKCRCLDSVLG